MKKLNSLQMLDVQGGGIEALYSEDCGNCIAAIGAQAGLGVAAGGATGPLAPFIIAAAIIAALGNTISGSIVCQRCVNALRGE